MTIREELRACAATSLVDVWSNSFSFEAFNIAGAFKDWGQEKFDHLSTKDRATFLLLVAEAL